MREHSSPVTQWHRIVGSPPTRPGKSAELKKRTIPWTCFSTSQDAGDISPISASKSEHLARTAEATLFNYSPPFTVAQLDNTELPNGSSFGPHLLQPLELQPPCLRVSGCSGFLPAARCRSAAVLPFDVTTLSAKLRELL